MHKYLKMKYNNEYTSNENTHNFDYTHTRTQ